ncbi:MAG: hypothetical protein RR580_06475 [Christensenellaceae bacterium]
MNSNLSNYKKRLISGMIVYGIFALGIVPVFTLIMGTHANILTESMSAMGSMSGMHVWFILWTIIFCVFFSSFVGYILILTKNTHSKIRILVYIATAMLVFGNILPFIPDEFPMMMYIHNFCAQISSISLAIIIVLLSLTMRKYYPSLFKKSLIFALCIWGILLTMISLFGTVSLTEMTSIILGSIYLFTVLVWLYKQENFDPVESLKDFDASNAMEEVKRLEKKAAEAKEEYISLEKKAHQARTEAEELIRAAKRHRQL